MPESETLADSTPTDGHFLSDVLCGLRQTPKTLSSKYFYDQRGSMLFEEICDLDEYYLTRAELEIIETYADEMAKQIDDKVMLVEYGSGSSIKTRLLLDVLIDPACYVPVDISSEHLEETARILASSYPKIEIAPVCADFTKAFELPQVESDYSHIAVYFPGSTIGNFTEAGTERILKEIARLVGAGGGLLIGIDLHKAVDVIEPAYNDAAGVTEQFNKNLLVRINRELNGNFDTTRFRHVAEYNTDRYRVESYLVSEESQTVSIGDEKFQFEAGEAILTEYSHKYTVEQFEKIAETAGFELHRHWVDSKKLFGVLHLVVGETPTTSE